MDLKDVIADILEREGISQGVLARRVGVHQTTVSRALRREPTRRSAAHARLRGVMQQHAERTTPPPDLVLDAVRETWDGSDEHAAALAKLILASGDLWPTLGEETAP